MTLPCAAFLSLSAVCMVLVIECSRVRRGPIRMLIIWLLHALAVCLWLKLAAHEVLYLRNRYVECYEESRRMM